MRTASSCFALARRFRTDESAVSAVEFALILPILILLLLASFDVTRAVDAKNKTVLLSRTIADFVSSESDGADQTELANIIKASKFILYPYADTSDVLTINIESVNRIDDDPPKYQIDWSYPPANKTKRDTDPGSDVSSIRADVTYIYKLKFVGYLTNRLGFSQLTMKSSTSMSPRYGTPVAADW